MWDTRFEMRDARRGVRVAGCEMRDAETEVCRRDACAPAEQGGRSGAWRVICQGIYAMILIVPYLVERAAKRGLVE